MSERKIGDGHAAAMGRLGLKELRNAASPSRESVADSEIGLYGTQTQGEIAQARGGAGQGPEQEATGGAMSLEDLKASAEDKNKQVEQDREREQDRDRGQERERDGMER
jgi:hypothetical protein